MEAKDVIAIAGVAVTLVVTSVNLAYSLWSNKQAAFVNTVTAARLKWIDSLRDNVSEFLAVTARLRNPKQTANDTDMEALSFKRDILLHQIVLHLNPHDDADKRIKTLVDHVQALTEHRAALSELSSVLLELRDATADYLKKEWNRVKSESSGSRL